MSKINKTDLISLEDTIKIFRKNSVSRAKVTIHWYNPQTKTVRTRTRLFTTAQLVIQNTTPNFLGFKIKI
jgi:hypothetical protein